MNRFEKMLGYKGEAKIRYMNAEFQVLTPGSYVICVVTGQKIPLEALRYWSVERQEPYIDAAASLKRHEELLSAKRVD